MSGIRTYCEDTCVSSHQLFNPCDISSYLYVSPPSVSSLMCVCFVSPPGFALEEFFSSAGPALHLSLCYTCCCRVQARFRHTTRRPRGPMKKSTAYRSHSRFAQRDEGRGNRGNGYTPMYGDRVPRPGAGRTWVI